MNQKYRPFVEFLREIHENVPSAECFPLGLLQDVWDAMFCSVKVDFQIDELVALGWLSIETVDYKLTEIVFSDKGRILTEENDEILEKIETDCEISICVTTQATLWDSYFRYWTLRYLDIESRIDQHFDIMKLAYREFGCYKNHFSHLFHMVRLSICSPQIMCMLSGHLLRLSLLDTTVLDTLSLCLSIYELVKDRNDMISLAALVDLTHSHLILENISDVDRYIAIGTDLLNILKQSPDVDFASHSWMNIENKMIMLKTAFAVTSSVDYIQSMKLCERSVELLARQICGEGNNCHCLDAVINACSSDDEDDNLISHKPIIRPVKSRRNVKSRNSRKRSKSSKTRMNDSSSHHEQQVACNYASYWNSFDFSSCLHVEVAECLLSIAAAISYQFEQERPVKLAQDAYQLRKRFLGDYHPDTLVAFDISTILTSSDCISSACNYQNMQTSYNEAIEQLTLLLGTRDHIRIASLCMSIGSLLTDAGQFDDAWRYLEQSVAIHRNVLHEKSPEVIKVYVISSAAMYAMGKVTESGEYCQAACRISLQLLGPIHGATAQALSACGIQLDRQGFYFEARKVHEKSYDIAQKLTLFHDNEILIIRDRLAMCIEEHFDDLSVCEALRRENLNHFEKKCSEWQSLFNSIKSVLSPTSQKYYYSKIRGYQLALNQSILDLVAPLLHLGKLMEATTYMERCIADLSKLLSNDHPMVAAALFQLSRTLSRRGNFAQAKDVLINAISICKNSILDRDRMVTRVDDVCDVDDIDCLGKHQELKSYFPLFDNKDRAVLGRMETLDAKDFNELLLCMTTELSWLHFSVGETTLGSATIEETMLLANRLYGENNLSYATCLCQLVEVLFDQGKTKKARKLLDIVLDIRERLLSENHVDTIDVLHALSRICLLSKDFEGACQFCDRLLAIVNNLVTNKANISTIDIIINNNNMNQGVPTIPMNSVPPDMISDILRDCAAVFYLCGRREMTHDLVTRIVDTREHDELSDVIVVDALEQLSAIAFAKNDFEFALEVLNKALVIASNLALDATVHAAEVEWKAAECYLLNRLGNAHFELSRFDVSKSYYLLAINALSNQKLDDIKPFVVDCAMERMRKEKTRFRINDRVPNGVKRPKQWLEEFNIVKNFNIQEELLMARQRVNQCDVFRAMYHERGPT